MTGWIFGLSIDDKVEWKLAPASSSLSPTEFGRSASTYGALKEHPGELNRKGILQSTLRTALHEFLDKQRPTIQTSLRAIGVSAAGVIDREKRQVVTVGMSSWLPHREPILDLATLFEGLFADEIVKPQSGQSLINVRNETTAKGLVEWHALPPEYRDKQGGCSIFYVYFSEGVNACFISAGRPIVMPLNTEMGHMYPRQHVADIAFDPNHTGCDRHIYCFEGLASSTRIRKSWGANTPFAQMAPEAHDRIAYYAAQMCLNGIVTLAPSRILLGGSTFFKGLLPLIRAKVELMNKGVANQRYVDYADMDKGDFIQMASIPTENAGLAAALSLANSVIVNPGIALDPTGSPRRPLELKPAKRQ